MTKQVIYHYSYEAQSVDRLHIDKGHACLTWEEITSPKIYDAATLRIRETLADLFKTSPSKVTIISLCRL